MGSGATVACYALERRVYAVGGGCEAEEGKIGLHECEWRQSKADATVATATITTMTTRSTYDVDGYGDDDDDDEQNTNRTDESQRQC